MKNYYYSGVFINFEKSYDENGPNFYLLIWYLLAIIIDILSVAGLLTAINYCWKCPEWLSVTPKHITGIYLCLWALKMQPRK